MSIYHIYDSTTFLYKETVTADVAPENSVEGFLPEQTEYYSIAYIDGSWVSVVNPKYEIVDNQFVEKIQG